MATDVFKDLRRQDVTLPTKALHGAQYLLDYPSTRIEIQTFSRNRFTGEVATKWKFCIRVLV
jgi:hypothetical protein